MCRILAMMSVEPSDAKRYLLDAECSLFKLSHVRRQNLQSDGWGVAYYVNGHPIVRKSAKPVYEELDQFRLVSQEARSNIIVAHVRKASNPRGLPLKQLIGIENVQPFSSDEYVFAHNGIINLPDEFEKELGGYRAKIRGANDSEIYFWYLMKEVHSGKNSVEVFASLVALLDNLWIKFRDSHRDKSLPYTGLNTILADGKKLYAFCKFHDEYPEGKLSLCQREQRYYQMSYLPGEKQLVVASEKLTMEDGWKILDTGQVLIAEIVGEQIHYEVVETPELVIR